MQHTKMKDNQKQYENLNISKKIFISRKNVSRSSGVYLSKKTGRQTGFTERRSRVRSAFTAGQSALLLL